MNNLESANEFSNHLRLNNMIQIELAEMKNVDSVLSEETLSKWVSDHSEKFIEIVSKKASENPNFWSDLEDKELRKQILQDIAEILYLDNEPNLDKKAA